MIGTIKTSPRWLTMAAVAAVVAAIASPAAAGVRPDDRAGVHGPGASPATALYRAVRPDDRAGRRGVVRTSRILHALQPLAATSDSFDWNAGLVGGGVASGAATLLVLGALAVRRCQRIVRAAPIPSERSL
jgi:hypothetical protein